MHQHSIQLILVVVWIVGMRQVRVEVELKREIKSACELHSVHFLVVEVEPIEGED